MKSLEHLITSQNSTTLTKHVGRTDSSFFCWALDFDRPTIYQEGADHSELYLTRRQRVEAVLSCLLTRILLHPFLFYGTDDQVTAHQS
jgi:hypothetical protein